MQGDKTDLNPDMTPKIRHKGDMIGIHIPFLNRAKLIDGPTAFELGMTLTRLGRRLEAVYEASRRDADSAFEGNPGDPGWLSEQEKEEYKAFLMEAMLKRLGITADEDSEDDLDET